MNGLGNDFIILDGRISKVALTPQELTIIADRHKGLGCDQIIILESPSYPHAHVLMRIYNADGHEAQACGNATRCVAWLIAKEQEEDEILIETRSGLRYTKCLSEHEVKVNMGKPSFEWDKIPLSSAHAMDIALGSLRNPTAVNIGNPHLVFFAKDPQELELVALGSQLEHLPFFPEGINVNIAHITSPTSLQLRVWERGVGLTQACGTGACAAVAVAVTKNLIQQHCQVIQTGGKLQIDIDADNFIMMTGKVAENFRGYFSTSLFENN